MLRVNNLFIGGVNQERPRIVVPVTVSTNNINIFNAAVAVGGEYSPADNVVNGLISLVYSDGVRNGSASTLTPSLITGAGYGEGWECEVTDEGNVEYWIQGKGGAGAIGSQLDIGKGILTQQGGCGGGGAGTQPGAGASGVPGSESQDGDNGTASAGGAGGPGSDEVASTGANGEDGGDCIEVTADANAPPLFLRPGPGSTVHVWPGGGGGGGGGSGAGNDGGDGGDPGEDGENGGGTGGGTGGVKGVAYIETGNSITEGGEGTVDQL